MLEEFKPTWMVKSIYSVLPAQLKENGIKAVFSDLDNTLIAWNNPNGTEELHQWMDELKENNIPLIVISNNNKKRIEKAVAPLGLPFMARSLKPLSFGIDRARKKLGLKKEEVVMVGDQLMTDMLAAHHAGVRSILVKPIIETDKWTTKINRTLEKQVWRELKKKYPNLTWQEELND
ncbi:YqeG family HAD IIIA-type phosphatase [Lactobacillaceae bacterium 24-114]